MTNIVENYAHAILEIYDEQKDKATFFEQIKLLKNIFKNEKDLIKLLGSPMLLKIERSAVIDKIFRNKINILLVNFLNVLVENGSFNHISQILKKALKKIDEKNGICFVVVESPFWLSKEDIEKIRKAIEKRKQKKVDIDIVTNKSLIGGLKIHFDSEMIDGSIKHKLDEIKKTLVNG